MTDDAPRTELPIRGEMIRLGQLLKLASLAEDGAEAKTLIDGALVRVNGEIEERRGRKIHPGDTVGVAGVTLLVVRG